MTRWRALANLALSSVLAPPCAACGRALTEPLAGAVCASCWSAITPITPPVCVACGDPLPSLGAADATAHRCPGCRTSPLAVDCARAVGPYEGALRAIIHALKYDGRRSVVPRLALLMRDSGAEVLAGAGALVPVPLHPRRRRARGFNQADDLAKAIGLPMLAALRRVAHTPPQVDLPAEARWRNVENAFAVVGRSEGWPLHTALAIVRRGRPCGVPSAAAALGCSSGRPALAGAVLVLIDDVTTTGATLDACARVLKAEGAREVRALTAARVVSGRR